MPKYNFDFDLDMWVQDVIIEADSYDEAKRLLLHMNVETILEQGYVKDYDIKQLDCTEEDED